MGLSTAYNIVRHAGGYIRTSSNIGAGSTFTVFLPRVEAEADVPASDSASRDERAVTETVLLVDHEAALRTLARRSLEMRGYRVLEAANGPEALQVAREHSGPIHILVADVVMPRMSGRELAFQLAPQRPEMKVLFTSGHSRDVIVHHGVLEKGINLLEKPFSQDKLAASLREVLDSSNHSGTGEEPTA